MFSIQNTCSAYFLSKQKKISLQTLLKEESTSGHRIPTRTFYFNKNVLNILVYIFFQFTPRIASIKNGKRHSSPLHFSHPLLKIFKSYGLIITALNFRTGVGHKKNVRFASSDHLTEPLWLLWFWPLVPNIPSPFLPAPKFMKRHGETTSSRRRKVNIYMQICVPNDRKKCQSQ